MQDILAIFCCWRPISRRLPTHSLTAYAAINALCRRALEAAACLGPIGRAALAHCAARIASRPAHGGIAVGPSARYGTVSSMLHRMLSLWPLASAARPANPQLPQNKEVVAARSVSS